MLRQLQNLLGKSFDCSCNQKHHIPVQKFIYESNVAAKLTELIRTLPATDKANRVAVVADKRTRQIYGQKTCDILSRDGFNITEIIVPDEKNKSPHCDDITHTWLKKQLKGSGIELIVAVGSGTINDLCKWSAFELGIPYIAIATAASVNGYAAMNVAAKINGVKVVLQAKPPIAVLADTAVIENAPFEMTVAGFGDTIAKSQSNADWLLNNYIFGEYYCERCAEILNSLEELYLSRTEDIKRRDSSAIEGLFSALFWTGIVMTMVGSSLPASGGEHLLSHTLDMIADIRNHKHNLHGAQVALGTIISAALYEEILKMDSLELRDMPDAIDELFWMDPAVVQSIQQQYTDKKQYLAVVRRILSRKEKWTELREKLKHVTRTPAEIKQHLREAGAVSSIVEMNLSHQQLTDAFLHMHEIRSRFTVVDLTYMAGILPQKTDEIIEKWLLK